MNRSTNLPQDAELSGGQTVINELDFSTIYDRYAPALLGIITKIVSDQTEAFGLLETTFRKIRSELGQFQSGKQPIFLWLLNIARCTALDALAKRRQLPVMQLTATGKIIPLNNSLTIKSTGSISVTTNPQPNELLDSVLFTNCTLEEAAGSVDISTETARQQLRLAMQQLRASQIG